MTLGATTSDSAARPFSRREQRLRALAKANRIHIEQVDTGTNGALRVVGAGVYLLVAGLRHLDEKDLDPQWQPPATAM